MDSRTTISPSFSSTKKSKWWSEKTVAVVTGSNKGIGLALAQQLAKLGLKVVLTSRDKNKGLAAVESIKTQGLAVDLCQLDVSDPVSISNFTSWLKSKHGGLDILVNNAGVSFNEIGNNSVEHAETVIRTNYLGPKLLTEALLPLFRRSDNNISRVLNVSSQLGLLNKLQNPKIRRLLEDEEKLTEEIIDQIVEKFLGDVKKGTWETEGWPKVWTDYSVSKIALNAYTRVQARIYKDKKLSFNCYCPGFTKTSMTSGKGCRTAEEAAAAAVKLLLLPPHVLPTGKFFKCSTDQSVQCFSRL